MVMRGAGSLGRGISKAAARPGKTALRAGAGAMNVATLGASGFLGKTLMGIKKDMTGSSGGFWKTLSKNRSFLGINVGVGSLLKQSQVFTGVMGSIFQIIGAMVDAFIAPFIVPLFVPLAKKAGQWIPKIQKYAQTLADKWVPKIQEAFSNLTGGKGPFLERLKGFIWGFLDGVPDFIHDVFAGLGMENFADKAKEWLGKITRVMKLLYGFMFDKLFPLLGKIIGVAEGLWGFIKKIIMGFDNLGNIFEWLSHLVKEVFGKLQLGIEKVLDILKIGKMTPTEEAMLETKIAGHAASRTEIAQAGQLTAKLQTANLQGDQASAWEKRYGFQSQYASMSDMRGMLQGNTQSEIQRMIQSMMMETMKSGGNVNYKFGQEGGVFNNFGSLASAGFMQNK